MRDTMFARVIQVGFLVALFVVWAGLTNAHLVNLLLLPDPFVVWRQMVRLAGGGQLLQAAKVTLWEVVRAYAMAAIPGLAIGFLVSRSYRVTRFLEPILAAIFTVPLVFLLPLFIFFFGIGPTTKVVFGGVYAFFPVVLTSIAAFTGVDRLYIRAAQSMGASSTQMFFRVYIPSALPGILTGLRIATVICIASVLGAEIISAANGLGHQISVQGELMNTAEMYAWIIYVTIAAVAINLSLTAAETWAARRRAGGVL